MMRPTMAPSAGAAKSSWLHSLERRETEARLRTNVTTQRLRSLHSISSSAVESSVGGKVSPSILAVSALMTNSTLVDICRYGITVLDGTVRGEEGFSVH